MVEHKLLLGLYDSRTLLHISRGPSFFMQQFLLVSYSVKCSRIGLPELWSLPPYPRDTISMFRFFLPLIQPKYWLQVESWSNYKAHFISFTVGITFFCTTSYPRFYNYCFVYFVCLSCFLKRMLFSIAVS